MSWFFSRPCYYRFTFLLGIGLVVNLAEIKDLNQLQANPKQAKSIMIIMDGSGSMHDKLESGKTRMEVAKELTKVFLRSLPNSVEVGLVAYGNRIQGCDSARLYTPLKRGGAKDAAVRMDTIFPAGSTPIARTIELVGKHLLQNRKTETEIILVSDGIESCEGSPEEEIRKLKKMGIKFRVNVLAMDVDKEGDKSLESIAKEGDGKFFSIKNPEELSSALNSFLPDLQPKKELPPVLPTQPQAKLPYIQITSIERDDGNTFTIRYQYENIPEAKNHSVFLNITKTESNPTANPLEYRESSIEGLDRVSSIDHFEPKGSGFLRIEVLNGESYKATAELWDMDGVPISIAISEPKKLGDAFFLQKNSL